MDIIEYKKIEQISEIWQDFYNNNPKASPTLEYEFVRSWNRQLKQKILGFKNPKRFFVIYENNKPQIIIPLNKVNGGYHSQYFLDYYDVLSNKDLSLTQIADYLNNFFNTLNCKVEFAHVNEESILFNALKDQENLEVLRTDTCVKIPIRDGENDENGYESYFNALSKNSRQNLRTSYNRLKTDNKHYNLEIINGKISKKNYKIFNKLYIQRRVLRYKNLSGLKKLLYSISEPILNALNNSKDVISYILKIDNKVASYVVALKRKNMIIVPRLVIDEEFKKYSIGNMIVNEIIKKLIEENSYNHFDLALGSENYKYVMGGKEHYNYTIIYKNKVG